MDSNTRIVSGVRFAVMLVGLIGNIITFIIFSRPVFQKNSISVYCRALTVLESFTIVHIVYEAGIAFFSVFLGSNSDLACIVYNYVNSGFGAIPGWILIALSIDKFLSMKNIGNSLIKKRWFQLIVITSIVLINLLLYIEVPIYLRLWSYEYGNTTYSYCILNTMPYSDIVNWMYLIQANIVPFLIMITTSIMSIQLIRKSSKNISAQLASRERRKKRDIKFSVTSIMFNFMFITFRLPIVILSFLSVFISTLTNTDLSFALTYLLYIMNFSTGIIVHLVSNNIFRREFLVLFRCQKSSSVTQTSFKSNSYTRRN
jgi:hypothetical protein